MTRVLLAAALAMVIQIAPADARELCKPRSEMITILNTVMGEYRMRARLPGSKMLYEFYANVTRRTWTMLRHRPGDKMCIVAFGRMPVTPPVIRPKRGERTG